MFHMVNTNIGKTSIAKLGDSLKASFKDRYEIKKTLNGVIDPTRFVREPILFSELGPITKLHKWI